MNEEEKTPFDTTAYLRFGKDQLPDYLRPGKLREFLEANGYAGNPLTKARKAPQTVFKDLEMTDEKGQPILASSCDFCGQRINGVSYQQLADGRIRCNECASTAIENLEEFKLLFEQCIQLMQDFYQVTFQVSLDIRTTDSDEIARRTGMKGAEGMGKKVRVLGFAQSQNGKHTVVIENGSPRLASIDTIVHEMTHIWQSISWNEAEFERLYHMGNKKKNALARLLVREGMAIWSALQFLYLIGETSYASRQEALMENRKDEYGLGFLLFREQFPLIRTTDFLYRTPFTVFPPIPPETIRQIVNQIFA